VPPAALPSPDDAGRKNASEEIIVTGSRVRRKDLTTPAPVTVISKEQITASGIASIGDFLQQMPEQGGATNTNVNNGGDGQTQISLRNLGAQRTLVLVDGKRWVNGGSGAGTTIAAVDLNSIPASAIERIEVLKDGASALYGSDAIGGVVNIITRRRVNGVELTGYGGMSPHGDAEQYNASVTGGAVSDKGSFMFTAEYFDQRAMLAGNRDWAKVALNHFYNTGKTSTGGSGTIPSGRILVDPADPACTKPLCAALASAFGAGARYYMPDATKPACPATGAPMDGSCQVNGWRPYLNATAAARLGVPNDLYNYQSVNFLITPSTRKSLFANGEYHVSDSARAYFQGSFLNRASSNLLAPEPLTTSSFGIVTSATNPYNPFGVDVADARRRLVEYAGRSQSFDLDTVRTVAGIDGTLPSEFGPLQGVYWDLAFNYGRTSGTTSNYGSLNVQSVGNGLTGPFYKDPALITATNPGGYGCGTAASPIPNCVPVNLFGGKGTLTPDMVTALGGYRGIQTGWNQIAAATANLSAELFKVASERPVGIAAGYEYRNVYGGFLPDPIGAAGLSFDYNSLETRGSYHVNEGYAELDIPVVSNLPLADDVEVQAAARAFNYSSFGSDVTYKFGGRWRPIRDVTLRGTYSTGFRAPDVSDLYGGQAPSAEVAVDPCAGTPSGAVAARCAQFAASQGASPAKVVGNPDSSTQLNSTVGGNPALQPEKANIGTVGVVFEPTLPILRGFTATVDYYNIKVTQNLGAITTPIILQGCYTGGNDAYCQLVQRDPNTGFIRNVFDLTNNIGSIQTSGFDFAARYSIPTDYGRFALLFDSTYLIYIRQTLANGNVVQAAGNYDFGSGSAISNVTPKLKFNAGVNYALAGLTLGVRGRYIGGYNECAGSDGTSTSSGLCSLPSTSFGPHRVPSTTLFDVYASYLIKTPFGSTTLSAGVRNLLDTTPPTVYNAFLTYTDPAYDLVGRFVYGRVSHAF
jgi:outer membrane receptor protein involved in Fe transport